MTHDDVDQMLGQLAEHADLIPVRAEKGGRWGSHYLTELTPEERLSHTVAFIERRAPGALARAQDQLQHTVRLDPEIADRLAGAIVEACMGAGIFTREIVSQTITEELNKP